MTRQSQDSFTFNKSIFPQCQYAGKPSCFYHAVEGYDFCRLHGAPPEEESPPTPRIKAGEHG